MILRCLPLLGQQVRSLPLLAHLLLVPLLILLLVVLLMVLVLLHLIQVLGWILWHLHP
jgi:hypothetical protein